jgi:protein-tyrosine phosphatase
MEFARAAIAVGGVVFAHCHAGSSRSGAVVCAYLMQAEGLTYDAAFAKVISCVWALM